MQASNEVWFSILGYITTAIVIAVITHLWVRHHLKKKAKLKLRKNLDQTEIKEPNK